MYLLYFLNIKVSCTLSLTFLYVFFAFVILKMYPAQKPCTVKVLAHWLRHFFMFFFLVFVIFCHQNACNGCENAENWTWSKHLLWWTKVLEAVCKLDWHKMRSCLFFTCKKSQNNTKWSLQAERMILFSLSLLKKREKERKYWVRSWDSVERKESSTSLSRSCGTIIPSDSKFSSGCQWLSLMHCKRYCSHRLKRRPPIYVNSVFACKVALNCQNTSQNACCGCKTCRKSNLIWFFLWRMKVSEAVCKCDWDTVRSYLIFNMWTFRTQCARTLTALTLKC